MFSYHWKCLGHWNGQKTDLKRLLKHKGGGAIICQKYNLQISKDIEKWPKLRNQV